MPKITFRNEATSVEVPSGTSLLDACTKAGVDPFRGIWPRFHCKGSFLSKLLPWGTCGRCKLWAQPAQDGATNAPTGLERAHPKIAGAYRLACQVEVRGDVEVTTKPGGEAFAPSSDWGHDPQADGSKWMERWRKAKAGGGKDAADAADPADPPADA